MNENQLTLIQNFGRTARLHLPDRFYRRRRIDSTARNILHHIVCQSTLRYVPHRADPVPWMVRCPEIAYLIGSLQKERPGIKTADDASVRMQKVD